MLKMDFPPNYGRILGGFELEIGRRSVLLTPSPGNGREGRLAVHDTARGRVPIPDSRLPPAAGGIPVPPPQGPAAAKCIPVPARQTVPSRGQLPYRYGGGFGIGTAGMSLCGISAGSPTHAGAQFGRTPKRSLPPHPTCARPPPIPADAVAGCALSLPLQPPTAPRRDEALPRRQHRLAVVPHPPHQP